MITCQTVIIQFNYLSICDKIKGIQGVFFMKIGFCEMVINPPFLSHPIGHQQEARFTSLIKGDLMMRTLYLCDSTPILIVTIDTFAISNDVYKKLNDNAHSFFKTNVQLIVNTSNTHSAPSMFSNQGYHYASDYIEYVLERFEICLLKLRIRDVDLASSFVQIPIEIDFLSSKQTVNLSLIQLKSEEKRIVTLMFSSITPNMITQNTNYLSSDYVGVLMELLKQLYPFESFMFFQQGFINHQLKNNHALTYQDCIKVAHQLLGPIKRVLHQNLVSRPTSVEYAQVSIETKYYSTISCISLKVDDVNVLFTPFKHHSLIEPSLKKHRLIVGLSNNYVDDVDENFQTIHQHKEKLLKTEREKLFSYL